MGSPRLLSLEEAWTQFSRRLHAQQWLRGTTSVSTLQLLMSSTGVPSEAQRSSTEACPSTEASCALTASSNGSPPRSIDVAHWNRYWERYSDAYGGTLDRLVRILKQAANSPCHRVLLTVCWGDQPQPPVCVETQLEGQLRAAAHQFGAVESLRQSRPGVFDIQFTTAEAAGSFLVWAQGASVRDLLHTIHKAEVSSAAPLPAEAWTVGNTARLQAGLAPRDASVATARLLLSSPALLPTAYVEGLFQGMLDAEGIEYHAILKAFVVSFKDVAAAQLALHALQFSLWCVFGMSLEYL